MMDLIQWPSTKPVCKSNALLRPIWMKKAVHLNEESRLMLRANADCQVLPALLRLWRTWTLIITQNDLPAFIKDHLNQSLRALALMLESNMLYMCGTLFQISESYTIYVSYLLIKDDSLVMVVFSVQSMQFVPWGHIFSSGMSFVA